MGSVVVGVNGSEVWAYVVQTDEGLRLRFALDDWQKLNLDVGRRIPIRLPEKTDVWFFITHATELPPIVWVTLAKRVQAAK
jgi:hypothetical protein